ncbi:hypothetical protein JCM10908_002442 [Rhodotorula pacifica]|uniref:uncharacterized protein n=1 Tax=Rhodotorula pacifica TaxID=1495444 RepID=UPI003170E6CF
MDRDLLAEFGSLQGAVDFRYPRQDNPLVDSPTRRFLQMLLNLTAGKTIKVYELGRQQQMRPDRSCTVKIALKSDLEKITRYLKGAGPLTHEIIWKWPIALVWPLNEAIHTSQQMPAHMITASMLLDGIPPQLQVGFVEVGRRAVRTTGFALRQVLWDNMTAALQAMIEATGGKPADERRPVQQLVTFLKEQLHLGTPTPTDNRLHLARLQLVSQLDVAVQHAHWEQIRWPALRGAPTTYATWLCDALYQVRDNLHGTNHAQGGLGSQESTRLTASALAPARSPRTGSWLDRFPHDVKLLIAKRCFELDEEDAEIKRCSSTTTDGNFTCSRVSGLFALNQEWSAIAAPYRFHSLSSAHLRSAHFEVEHLDRRGPLVRNFSLSRPEYYLDELESELGLVVEKLPGLVRLVLPETLVTARNGPGFNGHEYPKVAEDAPLWLRLTAVIARCRHLVLVAESVSDAFAFLGNVLPQQDVGTPIQTLTLVCGDMLAWRNGPANLQQAVSQAGPRLAKLECLEIYTARIFQAEAWPDFSMYTRLARIVVFRHRGKSGYAYYWRKDREELAQHLISSSSPTFGGCTSTQILEKEVRRLVTTA